MKDDDLNDIQKMEEVLSNKVKNQKNELITADENAKKKADKNKKIILFLKIIILLGLLVYNYYKLPKIMEASAPIKPLRFGTYNTDAKTDDCIKNLWKIASGEKQSYNCPVSMFPYVDNKNSVCCPNPEKHGLKSLCFEKSNKIVKALEK